MSNQTQDAVREAVEPVVAGAGLFLEDVSVSRAGSRSVVRVVVDLPEDELGGVDLDRVADVSRAVSDVLDATDVVPGVYTLEVGTPGTSRPLSEPRHFRRARGRLARVVTRGGATTTARVQDVVDGVLVLADDGPAGAGTGARHEIPLADVADAHVEVELKRMAEADLGPEDEED
ncbi:ribosome maturation factor RimP [Cellulomonas sp. PhB143]|uniref:ribosome maturation factor RimP n=1 Tax=Cellulomonas sp. PhB143 TaxID=2485186 RepID=UPI000F47DA56|nr:ribosome maturation factor RimP [Cellulomonas sp. PhB143]ROS77141.1 ribosome maturation factor RimP [Cellulomonas sp. PhB143]